MLSIKKKEFSTACFAADDFLLQQKKNPTPLSSDASSLPPPSLSSISLALACCRLMAYQRMHSQMTLSQRDIAVLLPRVFQLPRERR